MLINFHSQILNLENEKDLSHLRWTLDTKEDLTVIKKIINNKKKFSNFDNELEKFTNQIIQKLSNDLDRFGFNVTIASIHKIHSFLNQHTNKEDWGSNFHKNYINILKVINPIIPHFSNECLEKLKISTEAIEWPEIDQKYLEQEIFNIVTQINGKKRKVFSISKSINKETLIKNLALQ